MPASKFHLHLSAAILLFLVTTSSVAFFNFAPNGFDVSDALIDADKIMSGGPEKDGIPALTRPKLIDPVNAAYLTPEDRILGIEINGIARAYPIGILNWHEIVNDRIGDTHFAITYCPLCGTGVAFSSEINGEALEFGVSGLLYNSDVLLYDRSSESLWSQIMRKAITGKFKGTQLSLLPVTHTSWRDWQLKHPETQVLSDNTGYTRNYQVNPYAGYEKSRSIFFQVTNKAPDWFHPKERILGIEVNNRFKAYPFSELDKTGKTRIDDEFAGQSFTLLWDKNNQQVSVRDRKGEAFAGIEGFWFAWFTFHPETEVFRAKP